jgi:hypothetical protein
VPHERLQGLKVAGVRLEVVDGEGGADRVRVRLDTGALGYGRASATRRTVSRTTLRSGVGLRR